MIFVQSEVYIMLIFYRFHRVFFLEDECDYSLSKEGLTESNTVFLMMIITFVVSVLCVIAACSLIAGNSGYT